MTKLIGEKLPIEMPEESQLERNNFNLHEHPAVVDILGAAAKKLIEECDKSGYINPEFNCDLKIDDGRVFKLKFKRVDLD